MQTVNISKSFMVRHGKGRTNYTDGTQRPPLASGREIEKNVLVQIRLAPKVALGLGFHKFSRNFSVCHRYGLIRGVCRCKF